MYTVQRGVPEHVRRQAAELYWEAFGRKLEPAIGPSERGIALIAQRLVLDRAVTAVRGDELLGLAGFHLDGSCLVNVRIRDLTREFGVIGGLWRTILLVLLDDAPRKGELLMDGIAVRDDQRGKGIGTALLRTLFEVARANGLGSLRLSVVDTNPRARALYEREGFVATKTERTPYLRKLMGFGASTEMVARLDQDA